MPNRSRRALSLLATLLLLLCAASGSAQDQPVPSSLLTSQRLALAGPRMAIGSGAALLVAAPIVGLAVGLKLQFEGAHWLGCDNWLSGETDPQCEEEERAHDANVRQQMPWVIAGSATLAAGGAALLGWGIARLIRVRRAQREQLLSAPQLSLSRQGAQLSMGLRF